MPETLLSPSNLLLYGREITDLVVVHAANEELTHRPFVAPREGQNLFLQRQLQEGDSRLARIYAFSYEGHYYDLPKPALFLVHGPGEDPDTKVPGGGGGGGTDKRQARGPDVTDRTGVGAQEYSFSEDMKVWSYDKGDFSIRLDVETGSFEQILLDAILMPESQSTAYSGAHARLSGAHARLSGAHARLSGKSRGGNWSD
jgi:hypothetical protein